MIAWDVPNENICKECPARTECFTVFPRTVGRARKELGKDAPLETLAKTLEVSTQAVLLALGGSVDGSIDAMLEVVPPTKPAKKKKKTTKKISKKKTKKKPPPKKDSPLSDQPEVFEDEQGGPVCQACGGTGGSSEEPCPACSGVGHLGAGGGEAPPVATEEPAESPPGEPQEEFPEANDAEPGPEAPKPEGGAGGFIEYPRIAKSQVGRLQVLLDRGFTLTEGLPRVGFAVIDTDV